MMHAVKLAKKLKKKANIFAINNWLQDSVEVTCAQIHNHYNNLIKVHIDGSHVIIPTIIQVFDMTRCAWGKSNAETASLVIIG